MRIHWVPGYAIYISLQRFIPEEIRGEQKWRSVEDAPFAFQTGIKDTQKMNTVVYINETEMILYMEAIGKQTERRLDAEVAGR